MAFWGVEVKPGKPYIHTYESEHGRLRLSQATLGSGSSTKKSIVQCKVGDKSPIYLCSLLPEKLETCQLNLEFEEDDEVTFSVIGPHSVHLSGFYFGENEEEDDYAMNPYGEDIAETESGSDDSSDYDSEDDDEDDFIVEDDLDMYPPSPIPNSGVKIEEIVDDEKPSGENGNSKRQKKKKNQVKQSDDNENAVGQIVVKTGSAHHVLESEDEDGFPISSPGKIGSSQKSEGKKDEGESEKVPKKKTSNDTEPHKNLKRKIDAVSEDGENSRKNGQQSDSLLQTDDAVTEENAKKKKKNKNKKVGREEEIANDTDGKSDMEEVKNAEMENGQKPSDEKEEKKSKKKNKKQESAPDSNTKQSVTAQKESPKTETKPLQVRTFPNGLVVEELAMGKPDGKGASNGKKVSVHYIGKLKNNGKIFDSNIGRAPFKFRLGIGQVIKGWDVGVNGMRVGDKRRLTIPPSMGYGAKGAKPDIPPNAWLVFDVELVAVN